MNQKLNPPSTTPVAFQPRLCPNIPHIFGNVDYSQLEAALRSVDAILRHSGAEALFVKWSLEDLAAKAKADSVILTPQMKADYFELSVTALRCNILKAKLQLSFRDLSCHLAQSPLARWFCQVEGDLHRVRVPSKSQLHRFENWLPEDKLRTIVQRVLNAATAGPGIPMTLCGHVLQESLPLDTLWADTTCVMPTIHFPSDWVLLRDIVRTLTKAIICIREKGLFHRMPSPQSFMKEMNGYAIAMSQARRKSNASQVRKAMVRKMKKLVTTVKGHAQRYRELLDKDFAKAGLSRGQANVILGRMDSMLNQLPAAIKQVHERIIGERPVANEDKIFSVYEPDIHVIVRGKAGAEVEFGNTLFLAEQKNGLIVDWSLEKDFIKREGRLIEESLERLEQTVGIGPEGSIKKIVYDRGGGTKKVADHLKSKGVINATCPRSPAEMKGKLAEADFASDQRRRGQTEGRIGIIKNVYLGGRMKGKGITHRQVAMAWAVLTHNVFKLADIGQDQAEEVKKRDREEGRGRRAPAALAA